MQNKKLSLEKRIKLHPELHQRLESLLDIVEDAKGDLDKADAAEELGLSDKAEIINEAYVYHCSAGFQKQRPEWPFHDRFRNYHWIWPGDQTR